MCNFNYDKVWKFLFIIVFKFVIVKWYEVNVIFCGVKFLRRMIYIFKEFIILFYVNKLKFLDIKKWFMF